MCVIYQLVDDPLIIRCLRPGESDRFVIRAALEYLQQSSLVRARSTHRAHDDHLIFALFDCRTDSCRTLCVQLRSRIPPNLRVACARIVVKCISGGGKVKPFLGSLSTTSSTGVTSA